MTGTFLGINLKYLLSVLIMFGLSICGIYYALTIKVKGKIINVFFFCGAISTFLSGIKTLTTHTGVFAQYLPIIEPTYWVFASITIILIFFLL